MTRILWGQPGDKRYELGVDRGVFYPKTGNGVSWMGLVSVSKNISGASYRPYYIDGVKFMDEIDSGNSEFSLETFATPKEFLPCIGVKSLMPGLYVTNQPRDSFGFSYRTGLGNDVLGSSYGYKIHIISEALTSSTSIKNATMGSSTTPLTYKWDIDVIPKYTTARKPISHVVVETNRYSAAAITALENILYGTVSTAPRLPTQAEINGFMEA